MSKLKFYAAQCGVDQFESDWFFDSWTCDQWNGKINIRITPFSLKDELKIWGRSFLENLIQSIGQASVLYVDDNRLPLRDFLLKEFLREINNRIINS